MKSIEQVQDSLIAWGEFWYRQENSGGSSSKSMTARAMEILSTGVFISGTANQVAHMSDSIYVYPHIQDVDDAMTQLTMNEKRWLSIKYKQNGEVAKIDDVRKKRKSFTNLFIKRAENRLCGLL